MKVPFSPRECGGLKNSFIDGKSTCCIDHSRWAHIVSASDSSWWSISLSIPTSSSPVVVNIADSRNTTRVKLKKISLNQSKRKRTCRFGKWLHFTWLTYEKSYTFILVGKYIKNIKHQYIISPVHDFMIPLFMYPTICACN